MYDPDWRMRRAGDSWPPSTNTKERKITTILADCSKGIMVADSAISDGDRIWSGKKVWRIGKSLIGFAGDVAESHAMIGWIKAGGHGKHPSLSNSQVLLMNADGLFYYSASKFGIPVDGGIEAIGSGAKAAMCAYEALGWKDPVKALKIVCKHDVHSRTPIRIYKL